MNTDSHITVPLLVYIKIRNDISIKKLDAISVKQTAVKCDLFEYMLRPCSSLYKGDEKSAIKQQFEPSAIIPWRSNHIGYGQPRNSAEQKSQKEARVLLQMYNCCFTEASVLSVKTVLEVIMPSYGQ